MSPSAAQPAGLGLVRISQSSNQRVVDRPRKAGLTKASAQAARKAQSHAPSRAVHPRAISISRAHDPDGGSSLQPIVAADPVSAMPIAGGGQSRLDSDGSSVSTPVGQGRWCVLSPPNALYRTRDEGPSRTTSRDGLVAESMAILRRIRAPGLPVPGQQAGVPRLGT